MFTVARHCLIMVQLDLKDWKKGYFYLYFKAQLSFYLFFFKLYNFVLLFWNEAALCPYYTTLEQKNVYCITALVLTSYCTFAPPFRTLHVCPLFLNRNSQCAPILWSAVNSVNRQMERHKYLWLRWRYKQPRFAYPVIFFWNIQANRHI